MKSERKEKGKNHKKKKRLLRAQTLEDKVGIEKKFATLDKEA
jgi:hypothetical protein